MDLQGDGTKIGELITGKPCKNRLQMSKNGELFNESSERSTRRGVTSGLAGNRKKRIEKLSWGDARRKRWGRKG